MKDFMKTVDQKWSPKGLVKSVKKKMVLREHGPVGAEPTSERIILRGDDPEMAVHNIIATIREAATQILVDAGKQDDQLNEIASSSEEIDEAYLAAKVLLKLQKCETALENVCREQDPDGIRLHSMQAVLEALRSSVLLWSLPIVEHEALIVGRELYCKAGREGAEKKKQKFRERDIEMAREFLERVETLPKGSGLSKTAIMKKIGEENGRKRSAAIAAINRGLEHLAAEKNGPAPGADRTLNAVRNSELPTP